MSTSADRDLADVESVIRSALLGRSSSMGARRAAQALSEHGFLAEREQCARLISDEGRCPYLAERGTEFCTHHLED